MIDGQQCKIFWYVDGNKISHTDELVGTEVISVMKNVFGDLTITRSKKHTFLGMNIEIKDNGIIETGMMDQLNETIYILELCEGENR